MFNLNRPAVEILIDLIYQWNQYSLNKDHVKFGLPMALDQRPDDSTDENTYIPVVIDPTYDDRFEKSTGFLYRRLPFSDAGIATVHADVVPPFSAQQLVDRINAETGLQLTASDLQDITYTTATGFVTLKAGANSLVWQGSHAIQLQNNFVPVYQLEGFKEWTEGSQEIPYSGTSESRLETLINKENGTNLRVGEDYTFSLPTAITPDSDGRNTKVTLTPIGMRLGGPTEDIFYRRLDMSIFNNLPNIGKLTMQDDAGSMQQLTQQINQVLGLGLLPAEILNDSYPAFADRYTVRINEAVSLAWLGSFTFAVNIGLDSSEINHTLTGFTWETIKLNPEISLYDILNQSNTQLGFQFNSGNIEFGYPSESNEVSSANTTITMTALPESGMTGYGNLFYTRPALSDLGSLSVESDDFFDTAKVVETLNDISGQSFKESDFSVIYIPPMQYADTQTATLKADPLSQRYSGSMSLELNVDVPIGIVDDLHQLLHGVLPSAGPYY